MTRDARRIWHEFLRHVNVGMEDHATTKMITKLRLATCLALAPALAAIQSPRLLPGPPDSDARWVPIEEHKKAAPALAKRFAALVFTGEGGETMPYRLFTPDAPKPGKRYPLVVFLHGSSGSGKDNEKQLQGANMFGALVWARPEIQKRWPCFVVAPQSDVNWPCVILREGRLPDLCPWPALGTGARLAFAVIDKLLAEKPIDPTRVYVTGHSMGGAGVWHMIAHRPAFFAAAIPICGRPDPATAPLVKDVPIWNFHGEKDPIETVGTSRTMIAAVRAAGGRPLYTEYPGVEHNAFLWAYTEPALFEWTFSKRRPVSVRH